MNFPENETKGPLVHTNFQGNSYVDEWPPNRSESSGLHRHRSIECSSLFGVNIHGEMRGHLGSKVVVTYHRGQNLYKKTLYKRKSFEAVNFVKITKQSLYKTNSPSCFLQKGTHQWQQHCKENHLLELFL